MSHAIYLPTIDPERLSAALLGCRRQWSHAGVFVMVPEAEKEHVGTIQATCNSLSVPLVGAVFPALVSSDGFLNQGMWVLCFETMPNYFLLEQIQAGGAEALAAAVRQNLPSVAGGDCVNVFLAFDAMVPNIGSLMDGVGLLLDQTPRFSGVNAGSETFTPMPCLFDADRLVSDGVLGIVLGTGSTVAVEHAYPVSESIMRATSAEGNRIITINGRPAFDVYQEVIAHEFGVQLTKENFYDYAVHFPFGVVTVIDVLVRIPVALGEDSSLVCVGEIPPNASLRLLRAPGLEDSDCVNSIGDKLKPAIAASAAPKDLLAFYCAGRRMHFGALAQDELKRLHGRTGARQLVGALSLGEIDSGNEFNFPRFHNAAVVCIAQR